MTDARWSCEKCGSLLGIERDGRFRLRYKDTEYRIGGRDYVITTVCRKCHTLNESGPTPEGDES
jgi:RNase P subunit RPR2